MTNANALGGASITDVYTKPHVVGARRMPASYPEGATL